MTVQSVAFQTEFDFLLPKGYVDAEGTLHRRGVMRLATAADEILPARDSRVTANPQYLIIILLSRVMLKLGTLQPENIHPKLIESLFVGDLSYLTKFYEKINGNGSAKISATCPKCEHKFEIELGHSE
jgi:hypothetical protein